MTATVQEWVEPEFSIGERIRKIREIFGMDQAEFGALFGKTDKAVSRWETGHNLPRNIIEFARHLEEFSIQRGIPVRREWVLALRFNTRGSWYEEQLRLPLGASGWLRRAISDRSKNDLSVICAA